MKKKLMRISTVPLSLKTFCKDLLIEIGDDYDVLAVSSPGEELDELAAAGIRTAQVKMERKISITSDLKSVWQLVRLFRSERPDAVHSITPKAGLLAMMAAWIARVPVRIHSFTGLLFPTATGLKRLILTTTDRATCAFATHILPEGEGVKHDLATAGITRKPMRVLGYGNVRGIDLEYYARTPQVKAEAEELRRRLGIGESDFVYVFVGRIVGEKGINELAQAFDTLSRERADIHMILAGHEEADDPLKPETKEIFSRNSRIHFSQGWISDVRPYYAAADALVFPSYREGFPNVVLEAGALELPSIVTDINGSREIIMQGHNGVIVEPRSAEALLQAMRKFATDDIKTRQMAANARAVIEQRYEARFVRDCLKKYYTEVIK